MIQENPDMTLGCHSLPSKNWATQDPYKDNNPTQRSIDERFRHESVYEGYRSGHSSSLPDGSKQETINTFFDSAKDFPKTLSGLREGSEKDAHQVVSWIDERISRLYREPRLANLMVLAELRLKVSILAGIKAKEAETNSSAAFNA